MKLLKDLSIYAESVLAISLFVGGVAWLTAIYDNVAEATRVNAAQDLEIKQQMSLLIEIRERVIRIEDKLPGRKK